MNIDSSCYLADPGYGHYIPFPTLNLNPDRDRNRDRSHVPGWQAESVHDL